MAQTLSELLRPAAVDFDILYRRHRPVIEVVRNLIGVAPNSFPYMEMWPTSFRTFDLLLANLLNLPFLLFASRTKQASIGLVMYASSRAAGCPYCSAHCCSFALRRGAGLEKVRRATTPRDASATYAAAELIAIEVAQALGAVPGECTPAMRDDLGRHFSSADVEWLVLAISMMGFLNKFMDVMGMPLEETTYAEVDAVIGPSGWTPGKHRAARDPGRPTAPHEVRADGLGTKLALVPLLPSAIFRQQRWMSGTPTSWPMLGDYLRQRTGHEFEVLSKLRHTRARRAIAAAVCDNSDAARSNIEPRTKHLAGLVYANAVQDEALVRAARAMAKKAGAGNAELDGGHDGMDERAKTILAFAKAAAPSPAQITPELIARSADNLSPVEIIELITWLSVMQLLHRLEAFYAFRA